MIEHIGALDSRAPLLVDVCIVGGGPAGIAIALALEGSGLRIALLESGTTEPDDATQELCAGTSERGLPPLELRESRLRYLGGATNHWGGACGRLDAIDFEARPWFPNSGWPFARAELDPWYERAEALLELGGRSDEVRARADLFDLAESALEHRVRIAKPVAFGQRFRDALEKSDAIRVVLGANVVGFDFGDELASVRGVRARSLAGRELGVRARATVVACGGVENARVLLAAGLGRKLDAIGRHFLWHARLECASIVLAKPFPEVAQPYDWHEEEGRRVAYSLVLSRDAQDFEELPNHGLFLFPKQQPMGRAIDALAARARGERAASGIGDDLSVVLSDLAGALEYARSHGTLQLEAWLDQVPNPDSRIVLASETDALGQPRAHVAWNYYDYERNWVAELARRVARELGAAGIGRLRLEQSFLEPGGFEEALRQGNGGGHQMGTTRMSAGPATGVVDAHGRVHGVAGLYCAGSSVFPTGGWMNPTLTILALALRQAAHLREVLR